MKNRLLQVVAAVPELIVGDVVYNTQQIITMIGEQQESALIVFPELSVTGYTCADLFLSDLLLNESEKALSVIADATKDLGTTVLVGVPYDMKTVFITVRR